LIDIGYNEGYPFALDSRGLWLRLGGGGGMADGGDVSGHIEEGASEVAAASWSRLG